MPGMQVSKRDRQSRADVTNSLDKQWLPQSEQSLLMMSLLCAFTNYMPSATEQLHHRLSEAATDHSRAWSVDSC